MMYRITNLTNGLRVATEALPGMETTSIAVSVGVGARFESAAENGISHLLEHMAFKGTSTKSARDIAEAFDQIGGQLNAYTSMEMTVYYAKVLAQDTEFALSILAEILQDSAFAEDELEREKGVIVQEIAMHRDSPEDVIVDAFDETCFPAQPLGRSILGDAEQISAYSREQVMGYMRRHYMPANMVLSAAGKVDHDTFVAMAERFFAGMKAGVPTRPERASYVGGVRRIAEDHEQLHAALGFPSVNIHDPRYHTLQLYASILGGGMSSRLFQEVREKRGLAYSVYAGGNGFEDVGVMSIYAATAPEKADELMATLHQEVRSMRERIDEAELVRAKNQAKAELIMSREASQTVAGWIGRHLLMFGEYRQLPQIFERIDRVNTQDVQCLAQDIAGSAPTEVLLGDI